MRDIELVGNALCLDFANTVNARPAGELDHLATVAGFHAWANAVGLPPATRGIAPLLPRMRALREAVYRVFSAIARGTAPDDADLESLGHWCADAHGAGALGPENGTFDWSWDPADPRIILWQVAVSAVDLLRRGPLDRIGECPSCGWLFLDTSKNGSRRWCSMATCGSRDKARRYYSRHLGERPRAAGQ